MNCPKCGAEGFENAVSCIACGEILVHEQPQQNNANTTASGAVAPSQTYTAPAPQMPYVAPPLMYMPQIPGDKDKNWSAICSMICGIASMPMMITVFGGLFTALAAIIFSFKGFKSQKRGMAIAGIICGIIGILLSVFMVITMISSQILYPELYQ